MNIRHLALPLAAFTLLAVPASALDLYESEDGSTLFGISGYAQPYLRWVEDPCSYRVEDGETVCDRNEVPDGFGLTRARIGMYGRIMDRASFKLELRTIPNAELLEAQLQFDPLDCLRFTVGRFKVPFSRQELTSESRLQLIDRASLVKGTPGRQLGVAVTWHTDFGTNLEDFFSLSLGVFNGESAKERAPVNNIDSDFLWSLRTEISPFGAMSLAEGDLRDPADQDDPALAVGFGITYEERGENNGNYEQRNIGADLLFAWYGVSLYGEVFNFDRNFFNDEVNQDYSGFGWNAQLGVFIPAPYVRERLELVGRVEEYDPVRPRRERDETALRPTSGGNGPANSNGQQAVRNYVAGLNWYFLGHDLKLQANYTHRDQLEHYTASAGNPDIPLDSDDDTFFLQLTYRF